MMARRTAAEETVADTNASDAPSGPSGVNVRMYRVGFGDFFVLTVPGRSGPAHILIDCGVHASNLRSIDACVDNLIELTGRKLALVILTHYHADHMSGFASNAEKFAEFEVGRVWITNRLDPEHPTHSAFMAQLTSVAQHLHTALAARGGDTDTPTSRQVENATGIPLGATGGDGGSNAKALRVLQGGFKNKPPVDYLQAGDQPTLPDELDGLIEAQILAPAPVSSADEFSASSNRAEQYLAAVADNPPVDWNQMPFEKEWPVPEERRPSGAFVEFDSARGNKTPKRDGEQRMQAILHDLQPDALAAAADAIDGTLNNQSLVVLFTVKGKKLLFVGDAQWGNWSYWLYGRRVTGPDPGISDEAEEMLGAIDFYKVGHHGSTNATPIPVVNALSNRCSSMCSTAKGAYGNPEKHTEVPRSTLIESIARRTDGRLVRSDWVRANDVDPEPDALQLTPELPPGFSSPEGNLYIDVAL